MELFELTKEEYNSYINTCNNPSIYQSSKMDTIDKENGYNITYVGIKDNNTILCATRLLYKPINDKKMVYYAKKGFIIDYDNVNLLNTFVKLLKKYIKKNNGYVLYIDPIIKDSDTEIITHLKKIGFKNDDDFINEYYKWGYHISLKDKDEKDIIKEIKPSLRSYIRKADHLSISINELKKEELPNNSYYHTLYDLFKKDGEISFLSAKIDLQKSLKIIENDKESLEKTIKRIPKDSADLLKETDKQINDYEKIRTSIIKMQEKNHNIITIANAIYINHKNEIILYNLDYKKEYKEFYGEYLLIWDYIKKAIKLKKEYYSYYDNNDLIDNSYYELLKSFNGNTDKYIKPMYIPTSIYYFFHKK